MGSPVMGSSMIPQVISVPDTYSSISTIGPYAKAASTAGSSVAGSRTSETPMLLPAALGLTTQG